MAKAPIVQEWAKSNGFVIVKTHVRRPSLLKKGSISTSDGVFAMVIPLPFEDCIVHYQPKKDDPEELAVEWPVPILLPENSALLLLKGQMKFIVVDVEYKVAGRDSKAGGA